MKHLRNIHLLWIITGLSGLTALMSVVICFSERENANNIAKLDELPGNTKKLISDLEEIEKKLEMARKDVGEIERSFLVAKKSFTTDLNDNKQLISEVRKEFRKDLDSIRTEIVELRKGSDAVKTLHELQKKLQQLEAKITALVSKK